MKVWLIEVNTNPSLATDCSRVTSAIIPKMLTNAFMLAVDPFLRDYSARNGDHQKYDNLFTAVYDDHWPSCTGSARMNGE